MEGTHEPVVIVGPVLRVLTYVVEAGQRRPVAADQQRQYAEESKASQGPVEEDVAGTAGAPTSVDVEVPRLS